MSIIDSTYFVNEILIAGLSNTVDGNGTKLTSFINKYEARFLKELLGEDLYTEFIDGLEEEPILAKWTALLNSLVNSTTKESPIANYVYYWYMRNQTTTSVPIGESKQISENANSASSVDKQVRSWNEMVDYNREVVKFIQENIADYPYYNPSLLFHNCVNGYYYGCYNTELFEYKNSLGL